MGSGGKNLWAPTEYLVCVQSFPDGETEAQVVWEVFTMQAGGGSLARWLEAPESEKVGGREEGAVLQVPRSQARLSLRSHPLLGRLP